MAVYCNAYSHGTTTNDTVMVCQAYSANVTIVSLKHDTNSTEPARECIVCQYG